MTDRDPEKRETHFAQHLSAPLRACNPRTLEKEPSLFGTCMMEISMPAVRCRKNHASGQIRTEDDALQIDAIR